MVGVVEFNNSSKICAAAVTTALLAVLLVCAAPCCAIQQSLQLGGPGTVASTQVELQDADVPSFLRDAGGAVASSLPAVKALVSNNQTTKRTRNYVIPTGYASSDLNSTDGGMQLPDEQGGLKMSRWVISSWTVANISAVDAINNRDNGFLERIPQLLQSMQSLAPSQVHAVAAANVTIGFSFTGIKAESLTPATQDAIRQAASDMAGGYSVSLITVTTTPPTDASASMVFEGSTQQRDGAGVVKRGKDLGQPTAAPPAGRRLQQAAALAASLPRRLLQQPLRDTAAALSTAAAALEAAAAASNPSSPGLPVWLVYRNVAPANTTELLLELCSACNVSTSVEAGYDFAPQPCGQEVKAVLLKQGVQIDNDTYAQVLTVPPTLTLQIRLAIGMTPAQVAAGVDYDIARWLAQPDTAQVMARVYAPDAVVRWLHEPEIWYQQLQASAAQGSALSPGVAAGIAVGCTAGVCGAVALAAWLVTSHRRKKRGAAADGVGDKPDESASSQGSSRRRRRQGKRRYLLPDPPRPDSYANGAGPGPASMAAAAAAAAAAGADGHVGLEDDTALSPDAIRPHLRSLGDSVTSACRYEAEDDEETPGQAGSGPSSSAAADAPAAAASSSAAAAAGATAAVAAGAAAAGVTAAVAAGGFGSSGSGSISRDAGAEASSSHAGAGASSSMRGVCGTPASRRAVLDARAAIVAEHRQREQQGEQQGQEQGEQAAPVKAVRQGVSWDVPDGGGMGSSGGRGGSSGGSRYAARAAAQQDAELMTPTAVSPELAAAAQMSSAVTPAAGGPAAAAASRHQGLLPSGAAATAAMASAAAGPRSSAASSSCPGGVELTPQLRPVDPRAAAASAAAVAAAATLPQAGAVAAGSHRASPFARSYNFDGLASLSGTETAKPSSSRSTEPAAGPTAGASAFGPAAGPAAAEAAGVSADPANAASALAAAAAAAVVLPPRGASLSPVSTASGELPCVAASADGAHEQLPAAAASGDLVTMKSGGSSSSNGSGQQQQRRWWQRQHGEAQVDQNLKRTRSSSSSAASNGQLSPLRSQPSSSSGTGPVVAAAATGAASNGNGYVGLKELVAGPAAQAERISSGM